MKIIRETDSRIIFAAKEFIVMAASHTFAMGKIVGGAALFFVIPMLTGYIKLKVSLLSL